MQCTLLHLYKFFNVKLGSMMQISHVDLRTLQIYLFEMPTNFLISNDVCVYLIQLMLDEIQLQA
jgi:hypothetical protein